MAHEVESDNRNFPPKPPILPPSKKQNGKPCFVNSLYNSGIYSSLSHPILQQKNYTSTSKIVRKLEICFLLQHSFAIFTHTELRLLQLHHLPLLGLVLPPLVLELTGLDLLGLYMVDTDHLIIGDRLKYFCQHLLVLVFNPHLHKDSLKPDISPFVAGILILL